MKNFVIPELDKPTGQELSTYLDASIKAFSNLTGVPVTFFDDKNNIVSEYQKESKICNIFPVYKDESDQCRKNISSAGQFASRLGEPYIFTCKAGLANIAMSLIIDEIFTGYFIIGPIVMGEIRNSNIRNFCALNNFDESQESIIRMSTSSMPVYMPNQISDLSLLFYNCVITSVSGDNEYTALRTQYDNQNKINSTIQRFKKDHVELEYPYDLERSLIEHISNGDSQDAVQAMDNLLTDFSILEVGNLDGIKAKCLWLFAIIMRIASTNSPHITEVLDTEIDIINRISDSKSYDELKTLTMEIVRTLSNNMLSSAYHGHSQIISKSLKFIQKNYRGKISLNSIEENFFVNASYFSTLFKREMGMTFTDYLNSLRIANACNLLTTTNMSIVDISIASGFEDQSYFTKVFKKTNGITPKVYRYSHMKK